ncbi:NADAR domain-containing protein [uncultured Methanobrevibacter sp.]|uniref:NADAR domain-containing protein n=1 Tax=uncultured Methanobrevibacter sp. TaxID=253161 RepID=UPI0025E7FFD0|nr:NADAR domain-containing protein [uncultured Methanobrevibacter sp.]
MKKYCDKGKYAAPRWLVYPELSAWTIGWRMGYGENYALNEPWYGDEYDELFPEPQNWLFDPRKYDIPLPRLGYLWEDKFEPKYSEIGDDKAIVNDFIELADEKEFRHNTFRLKSIEHAILMCEYGYYYQDTNSDITYEELKEGFEKPEFKGKLWEKFKYTVCLNASYYLFMQDEDLKKKLLETANKSLVYMSDNEWGGKTNLFGFALMELRDEIRRLFKNEDLIDWEYTEYLKNKNPYEDDEPPQRNSEDPQSPEYKVIESVLFDSQKYVRDVNLDEKLAEKYEIGQIITERAFVDASPKIGGMMTTHRYLIISQWMMDLSRFEEGTSWGLHTVKLNSKFKVIDIYEIDGKTQIVLVHLPDGFEYLFENTISLEKKFVKKLRSEFAKTVKMDVIDDLADDEWLKRCKFPIGMDDDGNFF